MMWRRTVSIAGLLALLCSLGMPSWVGQAADPQNVTVILSAFAYQTADGVWHGESGPFLNRLQDPVDVSASLPFCDVAYSGTLYDIPVVAVATGMGKVRTTACMVNILDTYTKAGSIERVIWSGIAGMSPRYEATGAPIVIGDVCITEIAKDFDLQHSSQAEDIWWDFEPSTLNIPTHVAIGDSALTEAIYAAGTQETWPDLAGEPLETTRLYHPDMAARRPTVHRQCGEITADSFWIGDLEDQRAREMVAAAMQLSGREVSPDDIIAASAMEGTGWGGVLRMYAETSGRVIPWTISRAASDFDEPWPGEDGGSAVTAKEAIRAMLAAADDAEYAAMTAAIPVLAYLEQLGRDAAAPTADH
jgi:purine nucleoside permease